MNFARLTTFSIVICAAGIAALLAMTVRSSQQMNTHEAAVEELQNLEQRIQDFSEAGDIILVLGTDSSLWQSYTAEALALTGKLEELGQRHPDARKAAHRLQVFIESIGSVLNVPAAESRLSDQPTEIQALDMPTRSRIVLQQALSQSIALSAALKDALYERNQAMMREMSWIFGMLSAAAVLFGVLCVAAFAVIHRRFTVPLRGLTETLQSLRAGNQNARAPMSKNPAVSTLARTLNRLIDEQQAADRRIQQRQRKLKHALSRLRTTRDSLLRAQRTGNVGSWDFDHKSDRLEWSDQALEILGVASDELGPTLDDFMQRVHPDDRDRLRRKRAEWMEQGGEFELEYRVVRPDGEVRWLYARAEHLKKPDGAVAFSTGTLHDITDRRRKETTIGQLQQLLEGTEDLCAILDSEYRYQWVNQAYAENVGSTKEAVHQRSAEEILGKGHMDRLGTRFEQCLAGEPQRFETQREFPGLGTRQILVRYYPIDIRGEKERQIGAVITDITDIVQTKAQLARQTQLLAIAGRAASFGGWSIDVQEGSVAWSDVTAEIHAMPHGYSPSMDEAISFYAPEYRDRMREAFTACAEHGQPYDEELQIINGDAQRRWVRTVGEAVRGDDGTIVKVQGAFQDITERKSLEFESQQLSGRMVTMLEAITDGFIAFDKDWRYVFVNDESTRMIGKSREALLGTTLWSQFPGLAGTESEAAVLKAKNEGRPAHAEEFFEPLNAWFDMRAYPWEDGVAVFFRDVTGQHEMMAQLRAQHVELQKSRDELDALLVTRRALINSLPAHIALLDDEGNVIDVNEQWRHYGEQNDNDDPAFGVGMNYLTVCEKTRGECGEGAGEVADGLRDVLAGNRESFALEYPCHSPDEQRWFRVMFNRLMKDKSVPGGAVAMHVDVTKRKLAELQLERLAYEDPLTGLFSRNGFTRELRARLQDSGWPENGLVVMLDVVNQRDINDAHGYAVGDRLLFELGRRLRAYAGETGLAGRAGGDEFVVYLDSGAGPMLEETLQNLKRGLEESFDLDGLIIRIEAWIGFTEFDQRQRDPDDLVREAEMALFENRSESGAQFNWVGYTAELEERTHMRVQLTEELRNALDAEEFEVHFQPKVNLADGSMISAEALLRWRHPERGLQPPGLFIPIAEQSQLIGPIGDWVLRDACRQLRDWRAAGLDIVRVSVNVSLVQFALDGFPAKVSSALEDFGIPPSDLALEITESVFQRHSEKLIAQIRELHEMGVRLSLDDFGTGYSSLLYLQRYPFDEIKIDRAFVSRILDDDYSRNIVRTVMDVASALNAEVVAEGIESRDIAEALLELGCNIAQGYYYSMPLEAEDFRWLLEKQSPLPLGMNTNNNAKNSD